MQSEAGAGRSAYWDDQAPRYDQASAWAERRVLTPVRRRVCAHVTGRTLEVGVGTGANLPHYARQASSVTAVDASAAMLVMARRRADALGAEVAFVHTPAEHLGLPDASFDSVVCTFTLCAVDDERAALREMVRVLAPGGRLVLADHVESSSPALRAGQAVLDRLAAGRSGEHHRRRPVALLTELGLVVEHQHAGRWRLVEEVVARKPG